MNVKDYFTEALRVAGESTPGPWNPDVSLNGPFFAYELEAWNAMGPRHYQTPRTDEHLNKARSDATFIATARTSSPVIAEAALILLEALEKMAAANFNSNTSAHEALARVQKLVEAK